MNDKNECCEKDGDSGSTTTTRVDKGLHVRAPLYDGFRDCKSVGKMILHYTRGGVTSKHLYGTELVWCGWHCEMARWIVVPKSNHVGQ